LAPAVKLGEISYSKAEAETAKAEQCRFDKQGQGRDRHFCFACQ
jgi:hypothetical protein